VNGHGGLEYYICPARYLPVTGVGTPVYNGGSNPPPYACQLQ